MSKVLWIVCPVCGNIMDSDFHIDGKYESLKEAYETNRYKIMTCDASEDLDGYECNHKFPLIRPYFIDDDNFDEEYIKLEHTFDPVYIEKMDKRWKEINDPIKQYPEIKETPKPLFSVNEIDK